MLRRAAASLLSLALSLGTSVDALAQSRVAVQAVFAPAGAPVVVVVGAPIGAAAFQPGLSSGLSLIGTASTPLLQPLARPFVSAQAVAVAAPSRLSAPSVRRPLVERAALASPLSRPSAVASVVPEATTSASPTGEASVPAMGSVPNAPERSPYARTAALAGTWAQALMPSAVPDQEAVPVGGGRTAAVLRAPRAAEDPASPTPPPAPKKKSDLGPRAKTAAVLIPAIIGVSLWGGPAFTLFALALAGLTAHEYAAMLKAGTRPVRHIDTVLLSLGFGAALVSGVGLGVALPVAAAWVLVREVTARDERSIERVGFTLLGAVMTGATLPYLALLRALPDGAALTLLAFALVWSVDTFAYIVGRAIGKRKLAPTISPNKSWEGAIGGFVAALAVAAAFSALFPAVLTLAQALVLGAAVGVASQFAGLANSMIKRAMGVKDSGKLLPGHGGFLDRFDSFLLAAPLMVLLLALLL